MTDYDKTLSDSFIVTDSYSRIVAYKKDISEAGLVPDTNLYPSNTLIPVLPTLFTDVCTNISCKNLSDVFISTDVATHGIVKGVTEGLSLSDIIVKAVVRYFAESGLLPETTLYPGITLYPEGGIEIIDGISNGIVNTLTDSWIIIDAIDSFNIGKYSLDAVNISDSNIKSIGKYLNETGELPQDILYPANDFYPKGGMNVSDIMSFGFFRWLVDSCGVSDIDGSEFGIGKNINENINIVDIILFSIGSYFEENINVLDEISKYETKSLSDTFNIEDTIVRNITRVLSESMIIDDSIQNLLRTLVRATINAIKAEGCSLGLR